MISVPSQNRLVSKLYVADLRTGREWSASNTSSIPDRDDLPYCVLSTSTKGQLNDRNINKTSISYIIN